MMMNEKRRVVLPIATRLARCRGVKDRSETRVRPDARDPDAGEVVAKRPSSKSDALTMNARRKLERRWWW